MSAHLACTVITKNYLAYARTLANSLAEHNPNTPLYVLLADKLDDYFDPSLEPFKVIYLEELSDQETIKKMCFYYTPFELCCALRGALHEYIYTKTSVDSWIFLDSDIMVFGSLNSIFQQLEDISILLSPHCNPLVNIEDSAPSESAFLNCGIYNAGFLGLRRSETTKKFISWFKKRLALYSFDDINIKTTNSRGFFVDQRWLNLVPLYFKDIAYLTEPGANLGHWNLFQRELRKENPERITVNNYPLLFIHFSGFDICQPHKVSKYAPSYDGQKLNLWVELAKVYQLKLLEYSYEKTRLYPYAFATFNNGKPITIEMRRLYYDELNCGINLASSPFENYQHFQQNFYSDSDDIPTLKEQIHLANLTIVKMQNSKIWNLITRLIKVKQHLKNVIKNLVKH